MPKDVNIHVKAEGTEQAAQKLNKVGKSGKQLGSDIESGQKRAGKTTDDTTQKFGKMGTVMEGIKSKVTSLIAGFMGLGVIVGMVKSLLDGLQKVKQLQDEIYQKSLSSLDVGQALEIQTGTVGKQQYWAKVAAETQKAGGLKEDVAGQMLTSLDIAFSKQGGIKEKGVRDLAKELAAFVGANQLGGEQVGQLFEFAGIAGVRPDVEAYREYFGKLQAAYTSSKSQDFGQFMTGVQQSVTAYMTQGGTLPSGLGTFAAARAVMSNEAVAATLVEQIARLSGGAYAKPVEAMEKKLGVTWSDLTMDRRTRALLAYAEAIPERKRISTLTEQGFPAELATGVGKMVSREARAALAEALRSVGRASSVIVTEQMEAYLRSPLGKSRVAEAEREIAVIEAGPAFADWSERTKTAKTKFNILAGQGRDRLTIPDKYEPGIMALKSLMSDIETFAESADQGQRKQAEDLAAALREATRTIKGFPSATDSLALINKTGYEFSLSLSSLQAAERAQRLAPPPLDVPQAEAVPPSGIEGGSGYGPPPVGPAVISREVSHTEVHHHYDNSTRYYPRFGDDDRGPRF